MRLENTNLKKSTSEYGDGAISNIANKIKEIYSTLK